MHTFFSISIPVHNAEDYLDEAIESIINQDYNNYEIVLIDDSSTDNSFSICEKWRNRYPSIFVVEKNNIKGSLCARRECIHYSKGDYLFIMDADDYLTDKSALKRWDEIIQERHCDLLIFNKGDIKKKVFTDTPYEKGKIIEGQNLVLLYDSIATSDELNVLWDKVFSKDLIDDSDDVYSANSFLSHATDLFQSIAIISNAKKVCYINENFYFYRQTPGSITHKYNPNMLKSAQAIIKRRNAISDGWKYKPKNLYKKLDERALNEYCTVVNKLRYANLEKSDKIKVLEEIRRSEPFLNSYNARKLLPIHKRMVVTLIKHGAYYFLLLILDMIK